VSEGVRFPAQSVLELANMVSDASEQMANARSAVHEVTMDIQAYGQLCQFLPGLLSPLFGSVVEVMNDAVEALGETALELRATVTAMDTADGGSARRVENAAGPGIELPL